jgi:acyl-CoA synthetase (AMP-forming)/AMP-acid ligase II
VVDLTHEGTLVRVWAARWQSAPDRAVLHDPHEGWITGAQLDARSRAVAASFGERGVGRGCRVLLSGPTGIALAVVHVALLRIGAVVVPVNSA